MFNPLRRFGAGAGTRVAVVGMGGLGHVGVKIAHAMGAGVTVLGRTLSKREDGLRLGAERRTVASTKNGGIGQCQEMLDFCAGHGIEADTETVTAGQANEALDRLARGDVRYRFAIDISTLS